MKKMRARKPELTKVGISWAAVETSLTPFK
jgi:hypothetical protein